MRYLICLLLLAVSVACGGGSNPASPSSSQPYNQTMTGTVSNFGTTVHPVQIPRSGNMTLTLTWQDAAIDLDLYLAPSSCANLYPRINCSILAASNNGSGTSETIARTVSLGETFNLFVDNLHLTRSSTYTLTVRIQ